MSAETTTFDWRAHLEVHPAADLFPLMSESELKELAADIEANGLRMPIAVWGPLLASDNPNGKLKVIDGRNRLDALARLGWLQPQPPRRKHESLDDYNCRATLLDIDKRAIGDSPFELCFDDPFDPLAFVVSANLRRRHLDAGQRAIVGNSIANMRQGERTDLEPSADLPKVSLQEAARLFNVSERSVRHARDIVQADAGVANLVRAATVNLHEGRKLIALPDDARKVAVAAVASGTDVRTAVRAAKKADYNARIEAAKPKPLLGGTYRIIYADPPWTYGLNGADEHGHAERHYDCLTDEQLMEFKPDGKRLVRDIADKNSVLFLWVTAPMLEKCFPIIKAWGFSYKSLYVWNKVRHVMGHYNSVRAELLLIATRGTMTPDSGELINSVVQTIERSGKHSEKPQEFYRIIERMYTYGRKLELFARSDRDGWDSAGNESEPALALAA
jgi:N6-adenosine-specific RNA methylase IME4